MIEKENKFEEIFDNFKNSNFYDLNSLISLICEYENYIVLSKLENKNEKIEYGYILKGKNNIILININLNDENLNLLTKEELKEIYFKIIDKSLLFKNTKNLVQYLRKVKEDPAINFNIKNLAEPLISQLYKNKIVEIDELLNI